MDKQSERGYPNHGTWVKRGDVVRVMKGKYVGFRGEVRDGGGVALVTLDNGYTTWLNADTLKVQS
jgi:hypothetical protein